MRGYGGMMAFVVAGDDDAGKRVARELQVFKVAASLGGPESLIGWPPLMSHASLSECERQARGIVPQMLRASIGLEDADDLIEDLDRALACA
jgi:cystathionine beta-lyase/cystathionine gamma-synthase